MLPHTFLPFSSSPIVPSTFQLRFHCYSSHIFIDYRSAASKKLSDFLKFPRETCAQNNSPRDFPSGWLFCLQISTCPLIRTPSWGFATHQRPGTGANHCTNIDRLDTLESVTVGYCIPHAARAVGRVAVLTTRGSVQHLPCSGKYEHDQCFKTPFCHRPTSPPD